MATFTQVTKSTTGTFTGVSRTTSNFSLLMETGEFLLLETGDKILLEQQNSGSTWTQVNKN